MAVITARMRAAVTLQCEREGEHKRPDCMYRSIRTGMDYAFRRVCIKARLAAMRVWATQRPGNWEIGP